VIKILFACTAETFAMIQSVFTLEQTVNIYSSFARIKLKDEMKCPTLHAMLESSPIAQHGLYFVACDR
jgi:hypothetical protein